MMGKSLKRNGAPTRTRTWDPLIKSQLLYHLSYGRISPRMQWPEHKKAPASGQPKPLGLRAFLAFEAFVELGHHAR